MSQLSVTSPRPRPLDAANSPVPGAARNTSSWRCLNVLPLPSRKRLRFPYSPSHNTVQNGKRDIIRTAVSYTSREETSVENQARREDEEHGATQLILLLTLSVVLLTLPWVVDHPVTLLVPVALFILPITSDALRSLVSEGIALISSGIRWFWRHRNTGRDCATVQPVGSSAAQHVNKPQSKASHAYVQHSHPRQSYGTSAFVNLHQQEAWQTSASSPLPYAGSVQAPVVQATSSHMNTMPKKLEWQQRMSLGESCGMPADSAVLPPELTTPDLDFDSDNEAAGYESPQGLPRYGGGGFRQGPYGLGKIHAAQARSLQKCNAEFPAVQPLPSKTLPKEQAECTVYNWDEADECTQRRGHRSLSDLLSNVP